MVAGRADAGDPLRVPGANREGERVLLRPVARDGPGRSRIRGGTGIVCSGSGAICHPGVPGRCPWETGSGWVWPPPWSKDRTCLSWTNRPTHWTPAVSLFFAGLLQEACRDRGAAILVSSHHLDEVARMADRISVLHRGRTIGTLQPGTVDLERRFFDLVLQSDMDEQEQEQEQ
jgi:hypothetical protein